MGHVKIVSNDCKIDLHALDAAEAGLSIAVQMSSGLRYEKLTKALRHVRDVKAYHIHARVEAAIAASEDAEEN